MNKNRLIAGVVMLSMMLSLASCSKDEDEPGNVPGGGNDPAAASDYKNTYFVGKNVTLPRKSDSIYPFAYGDKACILARSYAGCDDESDSVDQDYLYICNYDGQIEKEVELEIPREASVWSCCDIGEDRFAVCCDGSGFLLYDYDGNLIKQGSAEPDDYSFYSSIAKTDEGFVRMQGTKISRYDRDGNLTDEFEYDNSSFDMNGVFEQNGKLYGYGMDMSDMGSGPMTEVAMAYDEDSYVYYEIDMDLETVERYCTTAELGGVRLMDWYGADYCNYYCCDTVGTELVRIDLENKQAVPIADKGNMVIQPPTVCGNSYIDLSYKFLDETHMYRDYIYHGEDLDVEEISLISVNEDLHLADREKITLQGFGVVNDRNIANAAYEFNTTQQDYYLKLDDLDSQYDMSEETDNDAVRAQLMTKYSSGDVPDMFFGDFMDYDYLGENGLIMDVSQVLDMSSLSDKLVRDDGKVYQIFAGYYLYGLFGKKSEFDTEVSVSSLHGFNNDRKSFEAKITSTDLVYNSLGCDLKRIYRSGKLTSEGVLDIVRFAIENGISQEEMDAMQYQEYIDPGEVARGRVSLYEDVFGDVYFYDMLRKEFGEYPVYVGYPSIDGSVHEIVPTCSVAVSSSTDKQDACISFINTLLSGRSQHNICSSGAVPVNKDVFNEYLEIMKNPDGCTREQRMLYMNRFVRDQGATGWCDQGPVIPMSRELEDNYLAQIEAADTVSVYDWGLYNVTKEEIDTYYTQGKSIEAVADALYSRYMVYAQENY
ncbi:MAG: hypothetical protein IKE53_08540 [Clostridiales bacterium]|nr:hypothetical protein [Clostridiales bacterium]